MKRISTMFLRAAIVIIGMVILAICLLLLPTIWSDIDIEFPGYAYAVYAVFVTLYVATVPFFLGLYRAWQLLSLIDRGQAFTRRTVRALGGIALYAAIITIVFIVSMPFFYIWGENDDAPGLILIGIVLVGAPLVVSVFAALLQRLMEEAVEIKHENELTV